MNHNFALFCTPDDQFCTPDQFCTANGCGEGSSESCCRTQPDKRMIWGGIFYDDDGDGVDVDINNSKIDPQMR